MSELDQASKTGNPVMTIFEFAETETTTDEVWPKYSDAGFIIVNILGPSDTGVYNWEYEIEEYDSGSCVLYISEGTSFEWWLDEYCEFPGPGRYKIEGIKGQYHRGDWSYGEDDDETWEFGKIVLLPEIKP